MRHADTHAPALGPLRAFRGAPPRLSPWTIGRTHGSAVAALAWQCASLGGWAWLARPAASCGPTIPALAEPRGPAPRLGPRPPCEVVNALETAGIRRDVH